MKNEEWYKGKEKNSNTKETKKLNTPGAYTWIKHLCKDTQNGCGWRSEMARHEKEEHPYSCF